MPSKNKNLAKNLHTLKSCHLLNVEQDEFHKYQLKPTKRYIKS